MPDSYILYLIVTISKKIERFTKLSYKDEPINGTTAFFLVCLYSYGYELEFHQFIKDGTFTESTVSKNIKLLEKLGYIECFPDPRYYKKKRLCLTKTGINKAQYYLDKHEKTNELFCKGLRTKEREELIKYLYKYQSSILREYGYIFKKNETSIGFIHDITLVQSVIRLHIEKEAKKDGLEVPEVYILLEILFRPNTLLKEIEKSTGISQSAVARYVEHLEKEGYVISSRLASDKRKKYVFMDEKGKDIVKKYDAMLVKINAYGIQEFSNKDKELYMTYLKTLASDI